MAATQPIRSKRQVRRLAEYFRKQGQTRNYILVLTGLHTALRISDILRLRWRDVYDFENRRALPEITLVEKKTKKSKTIAIHPALAKALKKAAAKLHAAPGGFIIENRQTRKAISRVQAYRIIRAAAEALKFKNRVSCHSLRKTFGYHAWKKGVSPAVIMDIYNHTSLAVTRRYLGVTQDDRNEVYLGMTF